MKYVTAVEAAKRIGVAEKTVRLWIQTGKLDAHHVAKNRLAIAESDVERLARERRLYHPVRSGEQTDASLFSARLTEVERRQALLEDRIALLEKGPPINEKGPVTTSVVLDTSPPATSPKKGPTTRKRKSPLPEGGILATDFARKHGVPRETIRDHMIIGLGPGVPWGMGDEVTAEKDHLEYSELVNPKRPHEKIRYLTREQQDTAIAFWRRHDIPFTLPDE